MNVKLLKDMLDNRQIKIIGQDDEYKRFSVVIPLFFEDEYKILFEVRSHKLKFQPSEVSLPGGKIEENETPFEAALRELKEEVGIEDEDIYYLGQFDTLVTYHGKIIYVFVVILNKNKFKPSDDEVDELFLVPISYFKNTIPERHYAILKAEFESNISNKDFKLLSTRVPIYFYKYEGKNIWGITAKIIYNFIKEFNSIIE